MSHPNNNDDSLRDIQDDWQEVEVEFRQSPSASTSPDLADDADGKASRKREREISLEPATPKETEEMTVSEPNEERRTPVTKKNRLRLGSTVEEEETPPSSPDKPFISLSTSPPHESKVRQLREKVRVLSWEEKEKAPQSEDLTEPTEVNGQDAPFLSDSRQLLLQQSGSDSDDQDKNLKRKLGDRSVSGNINVLSTGIGQESTKRVRDDAEEDINPRERKRPTPPPEEQTSTSDNSPPVLTTQQDSSQDKNNKPNGFLSYASTRSPFASAAGPSLFGKKQSPSALTSTEPNHSDISSKPLSAFPSAVAGPSSTPETPLGTKRTGFEAFASISSSFSAARPKSPSGTALRTLPSGRLERSKSPPRRALATTNAFSSYAGSTSPFAIPPVKKQRQEQGSGSETGEAEKGIASNGPSRSPNDISAEGSEDDGERQTTFSERLRAGRQDSSTSNDEAEPQVTITAQEVHTGEEDDETLFQVRAKLYVLSEQKQWKERGTGTLKINVRKSDGGGARLLMRKEAVLSLLLNAPLFKGMRCSIAQDPRFVRFSVIEGAAAVHYNLRLANAKVASELLDEINANIPGEHEEPNENV